MTPEEIQAEWDAFIEYPKGSGKLYVTTTSALIFARSIVAMAEERERNKALAELRAQPSYLQPQFTKTSGGAHP